MMIRWHKLGKHLVGVVVALLAACPAAHGKESAPPASVETPLKEIQVAADAFNRGTAVPTWVVPMAVPSTERRNPVVFLLYDTQLHVGEQPTAYVNRVIQINDSSALSQIGQLSIAFAPAYQRLHLHRVSIVRGGTTLDQTQAVQVRFLQREEGLEQGLYSGWVSASLLLSDLRVGDVVQVTYSLEGNNPVFGRSYIEDGGWEYSVPIELRHLTLIHPVDRDIRWKMIGGAVADKASNLAPQVSTAHGLRTLVFERRGIEGVDAEPQLPSSESAYRYVQFTEYGSWQSVARWADGLFPPVKALPDEVNALITTLRPLPDQQAQAVAALQWVQKQIRYFSISMGESSHRPHSPAEVMTQRFGDCKDKTYLLLSILRALGLNAKPVLLATRSPNFPSQLLPTPAVFDHVILQLKIGQDTFYLDPTRSSQVGSLANMGLILQGADALVVSPETVQLTKIVRPNALDLNAIELSEAFKLEQLAGTGQLTSTRTWHGGNAEGMRQMVQQLTPDQWRKFALAGYERRYPGIDLVQAPVLQDDPSGNRFTMVATFSIPKLADESPAGWSVKFMPSNMVGVFSVPESIKRRHPAVVLAHPYRAVYALTMEWPEDVSEMKDPYSRKIHSELFDLDVSGSFRGRQMTFNMVFESRGDTVQAEALPVFVQDVNKAIDAIGGAMQVSRAALKSATGGAQALLKERLRLRDKTVIERLSATISAGKLQGEDLAQALCDRAETLASMGQWSDGLKDAQEAVRQAPSLARAWECRGNLYSDSAEFERAIPDFGKALSLGSDPTAINQRRGLSRYYLGRYKEAETDFVKALQGVAQRESPEAMYPALWWGWSLKRQGKPLPPELVQWGQKDPGGVWPRPALALLVGAMTPEQVLAQVHQKQGDEREMNLAEAWFYIGQHHLLSGQRQAAREAFEKCRAQGITMYLEDMASAWELKRLATP